MVFPPLKCTWTPTLPQTFLKFSLSLGIGVHYEDMFVVLVVVSLMSVLGLVNTIYG